MNKPNIKENKVVIKPNNSPQGRDKELEDGLDPDVLAKQILIKGENKRIFMDYVFKIREKTVLNSKMEEELLKTYIFSGWSLRRSREIERHLFNRQQKAEPGIDFERNRRIKGRVRDLSRIGINEELKENNLWQEKLKKEMTRTLRQLREEQRLNTPKG